MASRMLLTVVGLISLSSVTVLVAGVCDEPSVPPAPLFSSIHRLVPGEYVLYNCNPGYRYTNQNEGILHCDPITQNWHGNLGSCVEAQVQQWYGATGATGPTGPPGASYPGPPGPVGSRGSPGFPGPSGPSGPIGRMGTTGARGFPGGPGRSGATGFPGQPGGPNGATGATGFIGVQGPHGPPGPAGPPGLRGPRGGTDGSPGNTGPTGMIGPAGATGRPGPRGPPGRGMRPFPTGVPIGPGQYGAPGASAARCSCEGSQQTGLWHVLIILAFLLGLISTMGFVFLGSLFFCLRSKVNNHASRSALLRQTVANSGGVYAN